MTAGERMLKDSDYELEDTAPCTSSQSEQSPNGDSDPKSKGSQSQHGDSSRKVRSEARWPDDMITVTEISADGIWAHCKAEGYLASFQVCGLWKK